MESSIGSYNRSAGSGQVTQKNVSFNNSIGGYTKSTTNRIASNQVVVNDEIDFSSIADSIERDNVDILAANVNFDKEDMGLFEKITYAEMQNAAEEAAVANVAFYTCASAVLAVFDGTVELTERILDGAFTFVLQNTKLQNKIYEKTGAGATVDKVDYLKTKHIRDYVLYKDEEMGHVQTYDLSQMLHDKISNSKFGQEMANSSVLDYDGDTSKKIAEWSEKIQKEVGKALSSKVWGGWLGFLLGNLYGMGVKSEEVYKDNSDPTLFDEGSIVFTGLLEGADWKSTGAENAKLAENFLGYFSKGNIKDQAITMIKETVGNGNFWKTAFKKNYTGAKNIKNYIALTFSVLPDVADYIRGEKELNFKNILGTLFTGGKVVTKTLLIKEFKNYVNNPHSYADLSNSETLKKEIDRLIDGKYKTIVGYSKDQQKIIMKELAQQPERVKELFDSLEVEDAESVFSNLAGTTVGINVAKILATEIDNKDTLEFKDISKYGKTVQKYVYNNLKSDTKIKLCEAIAKEYSSKNLMTMGPEIIKLRTLFEIENPKDQESLKLVWNNMDNSVKSVFGQKFYAFYDFIKSYKEYYDESGQPVVDNIKAFTDGIGKVFDSGDDTASAN